MLIQSNILEFVQIKRLLGRRQINVAVKLNKANAMPSKTRHYVDLKTQKSTYCAIFGSHLFYISLVYEQKSPSGTSVKILHILQKNNRLFFLKRDSFIKGGPFFKNSKKL